MKKLTLLNGPGAGKVLEVSDPVIESGLYFYFDEDNCEQMVIVNNGIGSNQQVMSTYMYRIEQHLSNGKIHYVGVY